MEEALRFVELFAGIGGFRFGLGDGFTCCFANELDKYARSVYRYHYGDIDGRDIRDVPPDEISDADLWTFGAPCQDFSVAGKRRGLEGDRGNLFLYTLSLLEIKRPRYFLAENVPGLLSIDGGRAFAHIIGQIAEMGYVCEWICLNSKDFGVPQNRERLFLVGNLGGRPRPEILSFGASSGEVQQEGDGKSAGCLGSRSGSGQSNFDGSTTLIATPYPLKYRSRNQKNYTPEIAQCVDGAQTAGVEIANPTIRTTYRSAYGSMIRRLTPLECERLQGFPDNWTASGIDDSGKEVEISDTQRYRQCGNAVTTNVIAHFGRAFRRLR